MEHTKKEKYTIESTTIKEHELTVKLKFKDRIQTIIVDLEEEHIYGR